MQHDFDITTADANTGATMRTQINAALQALVTNSAAATEPGTKYPFMWWADATTDTLKQRNEGNTAWVNVLKLSTGAAISADSLMGKKWVNLLDGVTNVAAGTNKAMGYITQVAGHRNLRLSAYLGASGLPLYLYPPPAQWVGSYLCYAMLHDIRPSQITIELYNGTGSALDFYYKLDSWQ